MLRRRYRRTLPKINFFFLSLKTRTRDLHVLGRVYFYDKGLQNLAEDYQYYIHKDIVIDVSPSCYPGRSELRARGGNPVLSSILVEGKQTLPPLPLSQSQLGFLLEYIFCLSHVIRTVYPRRRRKCRGAVKNLLSLLRPPFPPCCTNSQVTEMP